MAASEGLEIVEKEGKSSNVLKNDDYLFLPDPVVLSIFHCLSVSDLRNASKVCKQWNDLAGYLWKKWLKRWETTSNFKIFGSENKITGEVLKSCFTIGKERWLPHPIARLQEYVTENIEKAELNDFSHLPSSLLSRITLLLRLNPHCAFTTRGLDMTDSKVVAACKQFWEDEFWAGQLEDSETSSSHRGWFNSYEDIFKDSRYLSRKEALDGLLDFLHNGKYVGFFEDAEYDNTSPYFLDEEGNVARLKAKLYDEEDTQSENEQSDVSQPLPLDLYYELKEIFADKSQHFILYCLTGTYMGIHTYVPVDSTERGVFRQDLGCTSSDFSSAGARVFVRWIWEIRWMRLNDWRIFMYFFTKESARSTRAARS